jgi:hypothetical protein
MGKLQSYGKPMRALRALADTNPGQPLTESGVWLATGRPIINGNVVMWHAALATLVRARLAERVGRRGGYQWYITDAGRALLATKTEEDDRG